MTLFDRIRILAQQALQVAREQSQPDGVIRRVDDPDRRLQEQQARIQQQLQQERQQRAQAEAQRRNG